MEQETELTPAENRALQYMHFLRGVVSSVQFACLLYAGYQAFAKGSVIGAVIGIGGFFLIGTAKPEYPEQIKRKLRTMLHEEMKR